MTGGGRTSSWEKHISPRCPMTNPILKHPIQERGHHEDSEMETEDMTTRIGCWRRGDVEAIGSRWVSTATETDGVNH